MNCWSEADLELAAMRVVTMGPSGNEVWPEELLGLRDHAESCGRCRELLGQFLEVERNFRRELEGWQGLAWIPLRLSRPGIAPEARDAAPYRLAAESSSRETAAAGSPPGPLVFRSDDGSWEVIFQEGAVPGSSLVVLRRVETEAPGGDGSAAAARGLVCGARVEWFDPRGQLTWRGPAPARMSLVLGTLDPAGG